ncbi:MAG: DUF896 domain-containing protein [Lutisporaceae bacterium]
MITKEDIDRINFLSRKSREQALTDEEKSEQQALRKRYIEYIKAQVRVKLDSIEYVDDECDCCSDSEHPHNPHKH